MMNYQPKSIRTFIGSKNFGESMAFYKALGFEEIEIDKGMSLFRVNEDLGFYLQNYYLKDWIENSMVFLEVEDLKSCEADLLGRNLQNKFKGVKMSEIKYMEWGSELFLHDPSGVLWHFGEFKKKTN